MQIRNRVFGFLTGFVGIFLLPTLTAAKTGGDSSPDFGGFQWLGALVALIIVVVLAYWVTRFLGGKLITAQAKHLKVAESLFLGPNRHLYLLLVHGKVLLLGSTEHGINLIQEIDDPALFEELNVSGGPNQPFSVSQFSAFLQKAIARKDGLTDTQSGEFEAGTRETNERLRAGLEKLRAWKKGRR